MNWVQYVSICRIWDCFRALSVDGGPEFICNGAMSAAGGPIFVVVLSVAGTSVFIRYGVLSSPAGLDSSIMVRYPSRVGSHSGNGWQHVISLGFQRWACDQGLASVSKFIHARVSYHVLKSNSHHLRLTWSSTKSWEMSTFKTLFNRACTGATWVHAPVQFTSLHQLV